MLTSQSFRIGDATIGTDHPVYFIADIAANHDGDLQRAISLIRLAADAGASAAKFQHFQAETIVSDQGFKALGDGLSHQASWSKSVFDTYRDASVSLDWTHALKDACDEAGIAFFTSPYSLELVDYIDPFVPAFKIGSGDITWIEIIEKVASKAKPYLIASGASSLDDVTRAVSAALKINPDLCLMQCNTNYTASLENFRYINLNVLHTYKSMFPGVVLGLSDHTPGHAAVLGAVAMGARVIEKHFTDDIHRNGPDHAFSMDPASWREMVDRSRELENALGSGVKKIEDNELETSVLQRRAIRTRHQVPSGSILTSSDIEVLRPCPTDGISPASLHRVVGLRVRRTLLAGEHLRWMDLE